MSANAWLCVGMHGHVNRFCKVHKKSNHGIQWVTYVSPQCASLAPVGCASLTPVGCASLTPVGCASLTPVGCASLTPVGCASLTPVGCASLAPVGCASRCMHTHVDLFELVLHTGDHHWELELSKVAYINVDQLAETPCPARMMSYT